MSSAATETEKNTIVAVACDHAAIESKKVVIEVLERMGCVVRDFGADSAESVDYPDYAEKVAVAVASGEAARGILMCGTGIGMSIAANKVPGVRAALVHDINTARMSRLHNDANVLVLGGRILGEQSIREIVAEWMVTGFEGGRHQRRVDKIDALERSASKR